ncbi:MAG: PDR/VanB family oxidoreductase [Alphaproteobacteria bacterium]|nr:PDR/VanB family oxidoreductase [Alphaproteobacteria bacterium]
MMDLVIRGKREIAEGIWEFELTAADGSDLPPFTAGGHLSLETPSKAMRHYSLSNSPSERHRYVIAVKREADSRGGSRSMVEETKIGDTLAVDQPANDFPLVEASRYVLIAGGIGITPILSMARQLSAQGKPFQVIYCTRSAPQAAYLDVLQSDEITGEVIVHHDMGDLDQVYDFWDHFESPSDAHIYCCGPKPLMEEVRGMTGHWPEPSVHFEDFKPVEVVRADDVAFDVHLSKSGKTLTVPADRTILETVREAGITAVSSCESGTCGTCKTRYTAGTVDHRDMVLMPEEKSSHIMICVSRAQDGELTLDL